MKESSERNLVGNNSNSLLGVLLSLLLEFPSNRNSIELRHRANTNWSVLSNKRDISGAFPDSAFGSVMHIL